MPRRPVAEAATGHAKLRRYGAEGHVIDDRSSVDAFIAHLLRIRPVNADVDLPFPRTSANSPLSLPHLRSPHDDPA